MKTARNVFHLLFGEITWISGICLILAATISVTSSVYYSLIKYLPAIVSLVLCAFVFINSYIIITGFLFRLAVRPLKEGKYRVNSRRHMLWRMNWNFYSYVFLFLRQYLFYNKTVRYIFLRMLRVNIHYSTYFAETVDMQDANNLLYFGKNAAIGSEVLLSTHLALDANIHIMKNLINNAVKFTSEGCIFLKVKPVSQDASSSTLAFTVKDTGIGMTKEQLSVIFDAFTQADDSITRRYGGTGLGLAISRQILGLMGSDLQVTSEPGRGTEFTFDLAFIRPRDDEVVLDLSAGPLPYGVTGDLSGVRVLLAEDNRINAEVAVEILKEAGASVDVAVNGREAVDMALEDPYDIVLMDIEMPVMGGYEAARLLRESNLTLPVVAMTAHAMEGVREACLDAGMNDYIAKPIEPHVILNVLSRWLKQDMPSPSPASSPAAFTLPGIDVKEGTRRLMGKEDLYRKLLAGFFRKNASVPDDIREAIAKGETALALALAHTLKGTASTLSATFVHRAALELEAALREGRTDCDHLIEELARMLEEGVRVTEAIMARAHV